MLTKPDSIVLNNLQEGADSEMQNKGFPIIEFLVVIAAIGIFSALIFT